MKKNILLFVLLCPIFFSLSCHTGAGSSVDNSSASEIPAYRKEIRKEPVAEYKVKTSDQLNDWYFKVQLLETNKTFHYLLKMEYEEVVGEDTLKLPDFGMIKGKDKYSCIVGFYDKDNKFREYKLVAVKNGKELKLTTLNHYAVVEQ